MNLLWFLLLIVVLVSVHEAGHLVAAWLFRIRVMRVGIGLGPVVLRRRVRKTEYVVGALPIGGYVQLLGEDGVDPAEPEEMALAFHRRPIWQRLVVILSGPAANIAFAVVVFLGLAIDVRTAPASEVGSTVVGQPAADADIRAGDRITAIDGRAVRYWSEVQAIVAASPGREIKVTVERPGETRSLTKYVTPRSRERRGLLGAVERVGVLGIAPERRLPRIGVLAGSAAFRAGLRTFDIVTSVQGRPVVTVKDLDQLIKPRTGTMAVVTILRPMAGVGAGAGSFVGRLEPLSVQVVPEAAGVDGKTRYDLGVRSAELFALSVDRGSPAAQAGMGVGDQLLAVDGIVVEGWEQVARLLDEHPHDAHRIRWRPAAATSTAEEREAVVKLWRRHAVDEYQAEMSQWTLGVQPGRAVEPVADEPLEPRALAAVRLGLSGVANAASLLVGSLFAIAMRDLPASSFGGPIFVYEVAGVAASHGADQFLKIAAVLSINLGLLNLLPVPVLDGGQAVLALYELVRRRPPSRLMVRRATYAGLGLILLLLAIASINDLVRLLPQ